MLQTLHNYSDREAAEAGRCDLRWKVATGILRGRGKRAADSTILADAVATQDTTTQLIAAIRRVARQLPGAREQIAAVCTGHD